MKKSLFFLLAASFTLGAAAQDYEIPRAKHSVTTNSFWAN